MKINRKKIAIGLWIVITGFYIWIFDSSFSESKSRFEIYSFIQYMIIFYASSFAFHFFSIMIPSPIHERNINDWNKIIYKLLFSSISIGLTIAAVLFEKNIYSSGGAITILVLILTFPISVGQAIGASELINKVNVEQE